jgi:hypothetical protein
LVFGEGTGPPAVLGVCGARIVEPTGVQVEAKRVFSERRQELRLHACPVVVRGDREEREGFYADAKRAAERDPLEADRGVSNPLFFGEVCELGDELEASGQAEVDAQERAFVGVVLVFAGNAYETEAHLERSRVGGIGIG